LDSNLALQFARFAAGKSVEQQNDRGGSGIELRNATGRISVHQTISNDAAEKVQTARHA
jgi:hypothetical protein